MKIITVTLNPAFDKHCYTETFVPFQENFFTITQTISGGKGINISRALKNYGYQPTTYVVVGRENGDGFLRQLEHEGVPCKAIVTDGVIRENITLHSENQKETRVSFNGFSGSDALLDEVLSALRQEISEGDLVAIAGSLFGGVSKAKKLVFINEIESLGAKVVIDSRSFDVKDLLLVQPYFIKPNEQEISILLGKTVTTDAEIIDGARQLVANGIANVMVTLGERGGILITQEGIYKASVPPIEAVSTIGAGDSSIGGFMYGVAKKYSIEKCFAYAMAFGSAACLTEGTLPPKKADIDRLLNGIKIEKLS